METLKSILRDKEQVQKIWQACVVANFPGTCRISKKHIKPGDFIVPILNSWALASELPFQDELPELYDT